MGIRTDIAEAVPEVTAVYVDKGADIHGEPATKVTVYLEGGMAVEGIFTNEPRKGFGGVEFSGPRDIAGLMIVKIKSVLDGTAE